ncbi:hypothetical protein Tco_0760128 [Tanacetum coccineum]
MIMNDVHEHRILQLVILGVESKRVVPDSMLRLANDRVAWDKYPWDEDDAKTSIQSVDRLGIQGKYAVCEIEPVQDRVRQLAMMNLAHEFNDASTAKDELGKAYEKCRDIPLEQRDLIEIFLKTEAELDYQMNNALLLKAAKLEKQIRDKTAWVQQI